MPSADTGAEALYHRITSRFKTAVRVVRAGATTFRLLMVRDSTCLIDAIDMEAFAADERLPYWAELWPSSIGLARFCLEEQDLKGKDVLELGCGLGLAGIAAAQAGARVVMSDYDSDALLFARYNAATNLTPEAAGRVQFLQMDWRTPAALTGFDLIIGADIVYERRHFTPLLTLLAAQLRPGATAVLTDPDREIGRAFLAAAAEGFLTETHQEPAAWDDHLFTITRMTLRLPGGAR